MDLPSSDGTPLAWDAFFPEFEAALRRRDGLSHTLGPRGALRLYHGPIEGAAGLTLDRYGRTLVFQNTHRQADFWHALLPPLDAFLAERYPKCPTLVYKVRHAALEPARFGHVLRGPKTDTQVREHGVRYALDLLQGQDCGFYLDTRGLRRWLLDHSRDLRVLNCFAYTGSLGVVAAVGGAREVVQLDRNPAFLNQAKQSLTLNGLPVRRGDFVALDFFKAVARWRAEDRRFDLLILDPPYVSEGPGGRVDQVASFSRLINKARPLIADGGCLVVVNNALFLSGADFEAGLQALMQDGYLSLEARIDVPEDCAGTPQTRTRPLPTDPAPYNHATKIAVLRVRRRD